MLGGILYYGYDDVAEMHFISLKIESFVKFIGIVGMMVIRRLLL